MYCSLNGLTSQRKTRVVSVSGLPEILDLGFDFFESVKFMTHIKPPKDFVRILKDG